MILAKNPSAYVILDAHSGLSYTIDDSDLDKIAMNILKALLPTPQNCTDVVFDSSQRVRIWSWGRKCLSSGF